MYLESNQRWHRTSIISKHPTAPGAIGHLNELVSCTLAFVVKHKQCIAWLRSHPKQMCLWSKILIGQSSKYFIANP